MITFASATGAEISVSDEETVKTQGGDEAGVTEGGFTFKSTYLNNPEIAEGRDVFLMDADGSSFDKTAPGEVTSRRGDYRCFPSILHETSHSRFSCKKGRTDCIQPDQQQVWC